MTTDNDQAATELLGLEGDPVDITDESLHALIDGINQAGSGRPIVDLREGPAGETQAIIHLDGSDGDTVVEEGPEVVTGMALLYAFGHITLENSETGEKVDVVDSEFTKGAVLTEDGDLVTLILDIYFRCPSCADTHQESVAFGLHENSPEFFRRMADDIETVIVNAATL